MLDNDSLAALVDLDYAASTPMRPEAIRAQEAYDRSAYAGANPNSLHSLGRAAQTELEACRRAVAATFGRSVRASEVIFTGGGTESNHLAVHGIAAGVRQRHIDQAQSMNLYITNDYTMRQVLDLYLEAWRRGVKTIYYVRSKSLEVEECESCSS